jgi:hypothetical protein
MVAKGKPRSSRSRSTGESSSIRAPRPTGCRPAA